MSYKVDLHTHSQASPDGGLTADQYKHMLEEGLDFVAVTDHNTVDFAVKLQKQLGDKVIVGEEITTIEGEIIGLFLRRTIPGGLSLAEAVAAIKQQNGLVYVPHPFETVRSGLLEADLNAIAGQIDIVETRNGRAVFQNRSPQAVKWANDHSLPGAASSDSHGWSGWGRTYSVISAAPTRDNLAALLKKASYQNQGPGLRGVLYPKLNRLRKKVRNYAA